MLEQGDTIVLRGDIDFAAAELVLRKCLDRDGAPPRIDLSGVTRLHPVAQRLLEAASDGRRHAMMRSEIMAPPVAATTSTPATATNHVSSANPMPITPN